MLVCRSESSLSADIREQDRALREPARRGDHLGLRRPRHLPGAARRSATRASTTSCSSTSAIEAPAPDLARWTRADRAARRERRGTVADRARRQVRQARGRLPLGRRSAAPRRRRITAPRSRSTGSTPRRSRSSEPAGRPTRCCADADGILIPGGFGGRGFEGKIPPPVRARAADPVPRASASACTSRSPSSRATSPGWRAPTRPSWTSRRRYPVIDLLPEQKEVADLGGTMRLGADPIKLHDGTRARRLYGEPVDLRASPPPLRGQQPPAQAPAERGPA